MGEAKMRATALAVMDYCASHSANDWSITHIADLISDGLARRAMTAAPDWPDVKTLLHEIDRLCAEQRYMIVNDRTAAADLETSDDKRDWDEARDFRLRATIREELVDLFGNLWRGPKPPEPARPVPEEDEILF